MSEPYDSIMEGLQQCIAYEQGDKTQARAETVIGKGVKFERIRRITGYLVGTTDRFNNAKQAEERDRVKHVPKPEGCSACDK